MWQTYLQPFIDSLNGTIIAAILVFGVIGSWINHGIMGDAGVGVITGSVLVTIGVFAGLLGLSIAGVGIDEHFFYSAGASVGGALVMLLGARLFR